MYRNVRLLFSVLRMQSRVRAWQESRARDRRLMVKRLYETGKDKSEPSIAQKKRMSGGKGRSEEDIKTLQKKIKASMEETSLHALGYTTSTTTVNGVHYYGKETTVPVVIRGKSGNLHMFEALRAGPICAVVLQDVSTKKTRRVVSMLGYKDLGPSTAPRVFVRVTCIRQRGEQRSISTVEGPPVASGDGLVQLTSSVALQQAVSSENERYLQEVGVDTERTSTEDDSSDNDTHVREKKTSHTAESGQKTRKTKTENKKVKKENKKVKKEKQARSPSLYQQFCELAHPLVPTEHLSGTSNRDLFVYRNHKISQVG